MEASQSLHEGIIILHTSYLEAFKTLFIFLLGSTTKTLSEQGSVTRNQKLFGSEQWYLKGFIETQFKKYTASLL